MTDIPNFAKLVPGFDFLQELVKNAGAAMPAMGQWIAPTLNPDDLEKRINELKTVQFWLEQNARMMGATIQALEVQRMTLSTLKTMNVQMPDLREVMKSSPTGATPVRPHAAEPAPPPAAAGAEPAAVIDPMQWWTALTKQFTQLAASAVQEGAADAATNLAQAMMRQGVEVAQKAMSVATPEPTQPTNKKASPRKAAPADKSSARSGAAPKPRRDG